MNTPILELPRAWEDRLKAGALSEEEWKALRALVESGDVETLEEAARLRDFWAREIDLESTLEDAPPFAR